MGLFNQNSQNQNKQLSPLENMYAKYSMARSNLLAVLGFTVVNLIMAIVAASDTYFLFSASAPYYSAFMGQFLYQQTGETYYLILFSIIAVSLLIPYLVFWICSKKHFGFMVAALVYFIIDSVVLMYMYISLDSIASGIIDIAIHVWVLYYLVIGVKYGKQLKNATNGEMLGFDMEAFLREEAAKEQAIDSFNDFNNSANNDDIENK